MLTEKEKMIQGKPYFAGGEELTRDRVKARELVHQFNTVYMLDIKKRHEVLRELLGKTGQSFYIEPPFRCDYGYNISIGENFYSNFNCTILDVAPVTIGDNVMFAPNVSLFTAGHPIHPETRNAGVEYGRSITIGNNCWIGGGVIINPGITIGDNVVIGAGSVVTKDIPANSVAVGNPCRVIKTITDEDKSYYFKNLKIEEE